MARLCPQLRGCLHHILVGSESRSSRGLLALRHLDTCLGNAEGRQLHFLLPVLGHKRHDLTRTVHDVPTMPMHEVLAKELRDSATVPLKLEEACENGTLSRACWDHPVVEASSTLVLPVAVFMDGVAHSHTDSVLGVWAINMISQNRHVVALIRKRQMCQGGCQGWCSQFPLMTLLRWSLKATADGRYVWGHLDISHQFCSKACLGKSML